MLYTLMSKIIGSKGLVDSAPSVPLGKENAVLKQDGEIITHPLKMLFGFFASQRGVSFHMHGARTTKGTKSKSFVPNTFGM